MGRIVASVSVQNVAEPARQCRCDALVDTGTSYLVLPQVWKERLGPLERLQEVNVEIANQQTIKGELYGPVKIQIEGFPPIHNDVLFIEMQPENGTYDPLLGYIILEQSQAAVDMLGHRLIRVRHMDLK
ncbi:MAG: hypothetical protein HY706_12810 [Candidatus Hydrogenedentes bacterium]|nr:hypothetical protein [Candidatus Hydrogenedentota bacterium]